MEVFMSTFFGKSIWFSDAEIETKQFNGELFLARKHAERLSQQMRIVCHAHLSRIPKTMVVGKFLFKNENLVRYACHLVDQYDYAANMRWKQEYPDFSSLISFFLRGAEYATAILTWKNGVEATPTVTFNAKIPLLSSEEEIQELLRPLKADDLAFCRYC